MFSFMIRVGLILISWSTLFFLPKKSILKFIPVSLFSTTILLVESLLGLSYKWWKVKGGAKGFVKCAISFIFGPFLIGNLWIFHLTYGKFWRYTILNLLMDFLLAYPLNKLFQALQIYKLKKFKSIHLFLTAFPYSLLNYGFQLLMDKNQKAN
ncbi:MAG: hypothetical protein ACO1OT_06600 [Heyndrickxia sp.]